jgi:hypothetical protein
MLLQGWHNGRPTDEPGGYGLRLTPGDRDRNFDTEWTSVDVELDGGPTVAVTLNPSFWRSCPELRSAEIGRWLLDSGVAPWPLGDPPSVVVRAVEGNRFTARIHVVRSVL